MSDRTHDIPITPVACRVSPGRLNQLRMLAAWCHAEIGPEGLESLSEIVVTPRENISGASNEFMARCGDSPRVRTSAGAVSVPAVAGGRLTAAIVLDVADLNAFDQTHADLDYFALTLLEEMLHIRHYSVTFQHRGFIHYDLPDQCQTNLFELAYHLLDEYLVGRWKANVITAEICYGGNLPEDIEEGLRALAEVVTEAASARLAINEAWMQTADVISGPTFGALVREAGRRANRDTPSPAGEPATSAMFRTDIAPYWDPTLRHLEQAFADLQSEDEMVANIASQLVAFLSHCGVTLSPMPEGGCWLNFASHWADALIPSRPA